MAPRKTRAVKVGDEVTMVHENGTEKRVQYLGLYGEPARAHIWWPIAGCYEVYLSSGRIAGTARSRDQLKRWQMTPAALKQLRAQKFRNACEAQKKTL